MATAIYLILGLGGALVIIPVWSEILKLVGHREKNYLDQEIPQSMGAVFPLVFLVAALWAQQLGLLTAAAVWRVLVTAGGLGLVGLVDDVWGDKRVKGFSGHFERLIIHGELTTGFLKAALGFLVCLAAVYGLPGSVLLIFWRAALVALSANLLNLLDLRPGRALKVFFLLAFLSVWLVPVETGVLLLFPFLLAALAYLPLDLSGQGMLGDAGANILGGVLGLNLVLTAPAIWQLVYFIALVGLHVLTEKISLTQVIAEHPVLSFLDQLGCTKGENKLWKD
ncbi:MAG TPA: hypothetical protein VFC74_08555 [Oscillospiraceae bacterium]|nr:hypothetical protein [Oscillospiraceae bacterium]